MPVLGSALAVDSGSVLVVDSGSVLVVVVVGSVLALGAVPVLDVVLVDAALVVVVVWFRLSLPHRPVRYRARHVA